MTNNHKTKLPAGWVETELKQICEILDSHRVPINARERSERISGKKPEDLYPYYGATGQAGWIDDYLLDGEFVLLGEDGAPFLELTKDKAYIVSGKIWVNNHAHILKSYTSNNYLCHFLNQFSYLGYVTGTTRLKLNQSSMKSIPVKLPPLAEQHRIVAKIEELFSDLDHSVAALEQARAKLKTYRQAVLKYAFEGKLTEQWRQTRTDVAVQHGTDVAMQRLHRAVQSGTDVAVQRLHGASQRLHGASQRLHGASQRLHGASQRLHGASQSGTDVAVQRLHGSDAALQRLHGAVQSGTDVAVQRLHGSDAALQRLHGAELLTQIQTERQTRYRQQLADWQIAVDEWESQGKPGRKPPKPKKPKDLPPLTEAELAELPSLPEGWGWNKLGNLVEKIQIGPFGSQLHKEDYVPNGIPLINPKHIKDQRIIPDPNETITKEKYNGLPQYILGRNDIIMGRRGEMGRCAPVTEAEDEWFCGTGSLFIRPVSRINSKLYSLMISGSRVKRFLDNNSIGTTFKNLNSTILNNIPVPVIDIQEQQAIVSEIEARLSVVDKLEATIDTSLQQAGALRQSILKQAFAGNLVPQNPDDEPASALLERIKNEKN